jgi:ribosome-binding factor A
MKKNSDRGALHAERIQLALARELAELFRDEINDPVLEGIRVLDVKLSKDGRHARVHVAVPVDRDAQAVTSALLRATSFLRASVASALSLERTPELRFATHPGSAE